MTVSPIGRLVLVVDTDTRFADNLRALLADDRVITARTIEEAAEIVVAGGVDLALLGPSFGNEAGVTAASLLREADPNLVAVLAANIVTNRILMAALRSGMADVVDMPLTASKLSGILERRPIRREPPGTFVLDETPVAQPSLVHDDPTAASPVGYPITVTFEASSGLSTEVSFTQSIREPEAEVRRPEPSLPPAVPETVPELDGWAIPIDSIRQDEPEATRQQPAPPQPIKEFWSGAAPIPPFVTPPPSVEPTPLLPQPEPAPALPPSVDQIADDAGDDPVPPAYQAPRRLPLDLERVGLLPADGQRREHALGSGRVVAVIAGKGGSGKTITATNLAMALNLRRGADTVVLLDADLQFGDVALLLKLEPSWTLADAASQLDELSDARLDGMLLRHQTGLRVLAAPLRPAAEEAISAKAIVEVVERLRGMYEFVVIDTPPIFDDHLVTLLEDSDEVLIVVDMDMASVKNAKITLEALRSGRFPMERMRLVVNRANAKVRLDVAELERSLGLRVVGSIPSDRLVPQSVNDGVPVVLSSPRSRVARAFHALAGLIDLPEPQRRGA
jgi:MinD-like ATPase involved in chromosome partitioning or flagellar assembly